MEEQEQVDNVEQEPTDPKASRRRLLVIVAVVAIASFCARLLMGSAAASTALLYIGIPTILAFGAILLLPETKSILGTTMKSITLMILIAGIVFGEGFICILMASPLFYLIGWIIAAATKSSREKNRNGRAMLIALPFLLMSLEGTTDYLSFPREQTVTVERIVDASAASVEQRLGQTPGFSGDLPLYLQLGFPRPTHASGSGLDVGSRRGIRFGGDDMPGELQLEVAEHTPGFLRFNVISDSTMIGHWVTWKESQVRWSAVDANHTRVAWTLRFDRRLDPAWYFAPWERYGVTCAADYLISSLATPGTIPAASAPSGTK